MNNGPFYVLNSQLKLQFLIPIKKQVIDASVSGYASLLLSRYPANMVDIPKTCLVFGQKCGKY